MNSVLELAPISHLRHEPTKTLKLLAKGPVVLTQRGRAAAVLVNPDEWNRLIKDLDEALDTIATLKAKLSLATGKDELA
jgi:PHD/YefM family antitoxin component YafN of YafNO toxin-antitoxin module